MPKNKKNEKEGKKPKIVLKKRAGKNAWIKSTTKKLLLSLGHKNKIKKDTHNIIARLVHGLLNNVISHASRTANSSMKSRQLKKKGVNAFGIAMAIESLIEDDGERENVSQYMTNALRSYNQN